MPSQSPRPLPALLQQLLLLVPLMLLQQLLMLVLPMTLAQQLLVLVLDKADHSAAFTDDE